MKNLIDSILDLLSGKDLNCRVCGKLCHNHEPGCTVPPGEVGEEVAS